MGYAIAIDGPAGAGKSTVAKLVAKEKGYIYVDTGAMYRGLAVYFLDKGLALNETERMTEVCREAEISIGYEDGSQQIYLNGRNVTGRLREECVGKMASVSSALPAVRQRLLELQRSLAAEKDVVMDGRDIGTCVLPHADVKIFLTADVETRARRRYEELQKRGESCNYAEIAQDIEKRDRQDMSRRISPLKKAEDAVLLDNSKLTIKETAERILSLCR